MGRTALFGAHPPSAATIVMLFAPRDDLERDVVLRLVRESYEFAIAGDDGPAAVIDQRPST